MAAYKDTKLYLQPPGTHFSCNEAILGDAAYGLPTTLITGSQLPGELTTEQKLFNVLYASAHVVIEHAFSLLKGWFASLRSPHVHIMSEEKV